MDLSALRYTDTHEWVHWDGTVATIGITEFAVSQLSDLVFVDLPEVGSEIQKGETCGEIESVKAVGELNSPIDGTITEVNDSLEEELEKLSDSPFDDGWLVKMTPKDPAQIESLLDRAAYEKLCEDEGH